MWPNRQRCSSTKADMTDYQIVNESEMDSDSSAYSLTDSIDLDSPIPVPLSVHSDSIYDYYFPNCSQSFNSDKIFNQHECSKSYQKGQLTPVKNVT